MTYSKKLQGNLDRFLVLLLIVGGITLGWSAIHVRTVLAQSDQTETFHAEMCSTQQNVEHLSRMQETIHRSTVEAKQLLAKAKDTLQAPVSRGGTRVPLPKTASCTITQPSGLTAQQYDQLIDRILAKRHMTSSLKGAGSAIVQMEQESQVNGLFAISVALTESPRTRTNNFFGVRTSSGAYRVYASKTEAFSHFGSFVRRLYFNKGKTTVSAMSSTYCPPNAVNWTRMVTSNLSQCQRMLSAS